MTTWIILGLFLLVIIIMIAIAITGSKKDKKKRSLLAIEKDEDFSSSENSLFSLIIELGLLMEWIDKISIDIKLKKNNTKLTLGEVNKIAEERFSSIVSEEKLNDVYKIEQNRNFLKPIVISLKKTKPINWKKYNFFEFNIITAKEKSIKLDDKTLFDKLSKDFKIV